MSVRSQADQSSGRTTQNTKPYIVVIFGRTGVGISSLANLIAGYPINNDISPDAKTFTKKLKPHPPVKFPGSSKEFCLYEVPGFHGQFKSAAILEAIRQIDLKERIDLFIYCLRKQKATVMPEIVRDVRKMGVRRRVPMIAVVTELERFNPMGEMEDWWSASDASRDMNGALIQRMCFGEYDNFDAHACVTTLHWRDVELAKPLQIRRDNSERRIQRLILEQCKGNKRRVTEPPDDSSPSRRCC